MAILDRESLEQSPLADLHAIASELSIDGYRRLRKPELISAILDRQGGDSGGSGDSGSAEEAEPERPASRRRGGRRRRPAASKDKEESAEEIEREPELPPGDGDREPEKQDEIVEGIVELLPNGSGFVRVDPPEPSDGDVYISSAQVRRCELVSGDRVTGPRRAPRRSERFAALVRIDTVNDRPAAELADGARYDDLPASFPSDLLELATDADPTLQAVVAATPIGRGSRVTIAGGAQSGKTELLRLLAAALAGREDLQVWVVLAGVRPEELHTEGPVTPAAALSFAASQDALAQAVDGTVEQARRIAARGAHAVVLIDTLAALPPQAARKALAAARHLENGSLTVIATAPEPLGGETTVIALDRALAREGTFPAIDRDACWTMRADLLAG